MTKKKKIQFLSLEFENEDGNIHSASMPKADSDELKAKLKLTCTCGESMCIDGVKYRCMSLPSGRCVWMETNETC